MCLRSLGILLALVVTLVFLCGCFSEEPRYIYTAYKYQIEIDMNTFIENATFLLPIPTRDGLPAIGHDPISGELYADHTFAGHVDGAPPGYGHLNYTYLNYTQSIVLVDGRYYLQLALPFIGGRDTILIFYNNLTALGYGNSSPEIVRQMIDTQHPFGNESLFSPAQNLTPTAGSPEKPSGSGYYDPDGYDYSYTVPVYAHYENAGRVEISSRVEGENTWGHGFDEVEFNRYTDTYNLVITSNSQGWTTAEGVVTAGQGAYREWQLNSSPEASGGE